MMKLPQATAAAGLALCLAASPALADMADQRTDAPGVSSGLARDVAQALNAIIEAASTPSDSSVLASATGSQGPSGVPATTFGVDHTSGAGSTGGLANDGFNGGGPAADGLFVPTRHADAAAAPPDAQGGSAARYVGATQAVTPLDLSGGLPISSTTSASAAIAPLDTVVTTDPSPVPVPAAALLLGSGLLGMVPLRRSSRLAS